MLQSLLITGSLTAAAALEFKQSNQKKDNAIVRVT